MVEGQPMYSISYNKPEKVVRLTWLGGTEAMTDQDFKRAVLEWCDEMTVGKYNEAGVRKLVWVEPMKDVPSAKR